jgi:hypothetical protein
MEAHIGDRLVIDGEKVGQARRTGKVMGIQGDVAHPRLTVRWEDGHESLIVPGPGVRLEAAKER